MKDDAETLTLSGAGFSMTFSKSDGALTSWLSDGREMMKSKLRPNFWRPLTDNDIPNGHLERCGIWRGAAESLKLTSFETVRGENGEAVVKALYGFAEGDVTVATEYAVRGDGSIHVDFRFTPGSKPLPELPRLGMTMTLPGEYDRMEWYGRGPGESYPDRLQSSLMGRYSSTVWDQYHPYVRAQETGNHCDVRWMALLDAEGRGIHISGDAPSIWEPGISRSLISSISRL